MAFTANGTAFSFGGSAINARAVRVNEGAAQIDVTGLASTRKEYEPGLPDISIEVDVVGFIAHGTLEIGDVGDVSYTPQGASAVSIDDCVIMARSDPFEVDGSLGTTLTIAPTTLSA